MAKSAYKNLYGFTAFAAAAGLALCLTASGCSDDTSDPNPFAANLGTVTYNYTKAVAKAAELPSTAVKATYTFSAGDALVYTTSASIDAITDEETELGESVTRKVTIEQVPSTADKVSVMYFNSEGTPVGLGVDSLDWTSTTTGKAAVVDQPDLVDSTTIAAQIVSKQIVPQLVASAPCVDKGNYVWVKPVMAYTNSLGQSVTFDLSGFATYSLNKKYADQPTYLEEAKYAYYMGNKADSLVADEDTTEDDTTGEDTEATAKVSASEATPGYYKAVEYGQQEVTVSLTGLEVLGELDPVTVYISDAKLTGVTIDGEDDVYVVAPDYTFGQESLTVPGVGTQAIPFNTVSFKATGNYVGTNGPSFTTDASQYVSWDVEASEGVTGVKDALGHYVVTSKATSLKDIAVSAKSNGAPDKVTLHSLPAKADIKVNIAQEVVVGSTENGTVEGYFKVTTAGGEVETSSFNVPNYSKVKIGKPETTKSESNPTVVKNEAADGIILTLDQEVEGSSVSFDTTYKDGKKLNKTVSTTVKVIAESKEDV